MPLCKRCGVTISSKYVLCYDCYKISTYKDEKGYTRLKDTREPIHKILAEKKLGRILKPGEVVHHKNRDKSDNRTANLWVFRNQKEHDRIHKEDANNYGKQASYQGFKKKRKGFFEWPFG